MPRFVILEHDYPVLHWDLMLEGEGVLRTWRLAEPPGTRAVAAEPSFDHRLVYLEYEGPVSGDRGVVRRWDRGTYSPVAEQEGGLTVRLDGERLQGVFVLRQTGQGEWTFERRTIEESTG